MKRGAQSQSSMDMLLDTMCNTFGGVSFIALMVAIISAVMPRTAEDESAAAAAAELAAKESMALQERRDRLKEAVAIYAKLAERSDAKAAVKSDLAKTSAEIAASDERIREYENKRAEYLDELAKLKTRTRYSRKEALRLERMLNELKQKTDKAGLGRHRQVRTPQEREIDGLTDVTLWLHRRRLYKIDESGDYVKCDNLPSENGKRRWRYTIIRGRGVPLDGDFFRRGKIWTELERKFNAGMYVRIYADCDSFEDLCLLRDALIDRKSMYNWVVYHGDSIDFVEGYDGKVQ